MPVQFGVRLIGIVYLAFGIIGFLPVDALNPIREQGIGASYLLGLVAINPLHNVIHLTVGLSALWMAKSVKSAQTWGRVLGVVLLALFAAGMVQAFLEGFPFDQSLLGAIPLNSPGHILHLVSGGIALYLGLMKVPSHLPPS
jgi:hypothetical protein